LLARRKALALSRQVRNRRCHFCSRTVLCRNYGQAKEAAATAADAIRESAGEADDFLRTTIEQRPYTAAAVALAIGYLIGRFGRRADY